MTGGIEFVRNYSTLPEGNIQGTIYFAFERVGLLILFFYISAERSVSTVKTVVSIVTGVAKHLEVGNKWLAF